MEDQKELRTEKLENQNQQAEDIKQVSPFDGIKEMTSIKAFNILVQAANAAQRAGALSVSDSVYVAKAAEHLEDLFNRK